MSIHSSAYRGLQVTVPSCCFWHNLMLHSPCTTDFCIVCMPMTVWVFMCVRVLPNSPMISDSACELSFHGSEPLLCFQLDWSYGDRNINPTKYQHETGRNESTCTEPSADNHASTGACLGDCYIKCSLAVCVQLCIKKITWDFDYNQINLNDCPLRY